MRKKAKKSKCPICEGSGKIIVPAPVHYDQVLRHWIGRNTPEVEKFCLICKGTGHQQN
jgi:hypothetical protein